MHIVCSDLEGVFVPEIWINVAEKTGIDELRLTTRDIADYDVLMSRRLSILRENRLTLMDIHEVIDTMDPFEGAVDFMEWLRARTQVIVISDTFVQFAGPLMKKLGWPTLFCHWLAVDGDGVITDYHIRQENSKQQAILSFKGLNYNTIAVGDSYNDIGMLKAADLGILFHPSDNVREDYPELRVTHGYAELCNEIQDTLEHTY